MMKRIVSVVTGVCSLAVVAACAVPGDGRRPAGVSGQVGRQNEEGTGMGRILVAYGTKSGSTAGIAAAVGEVFREEGADVDVLRAGDVKDVSGYRAVVVGSGIYAGKWVSDAMRLVEREQEALRKIPVAYFVVCATMKDDTPEARRTADAYADPVRALAAPVDTGLFGGVVDYSKMNFFVRFMMKNVIKAPEGDFRDWEAIRAWAREVYPRLTAGRG